MFFILKPSTTVFNRVTVLSKTFNILFYLGMPYVLCRYYIYIVYSSTLRTLYYLLILRATANVLRTHVRRTSTDQVPRNTGSTEVESPQIPEYRTEEMTDFGTVPQYRTEAKKFSVRIPNNMTH
jgi:hypothetical protein